MPASTRRRITAKELQEDIDAFYALKLLTDYKPHDPNATVEAIAPIVDKIRAKQEAGNIATPRQDADAPSDSQRTGEVQEGRGIVLPDDDQAGTRFQRLRQAGQGFQ